MCLLRQYHLILDVGLNDAFIVYPTCSIANTNQMYTCSWIVWDPCLIERLKLSIYNLILRKYENYLMTCMSNQSSP